MTILRTRTTRTKLFSGGALLCAALPACSSASQDTTSAGAGGAGDGYPAVHVTPPHVVSLGGSVLTSPKVQLIAYASDPHVAQLEKFLTELTTTTYWSDTTSEYGVGPLTVLPTIKLTSNAPTMLMDSDLQSELSANTSGASPAWGAADPGTIYLFVLPQGSIVDDDGLCCGDFDGYHDEAAIGVPYAVVCSCPGLDGADISDVQQLTIAMSHELVESSTDPLLRTSPAYAQTDVDDAVWTLASGGEIADMCEFNDDAFIQPQGSAFMVSRSWSNKAADSLANPCVPPITTVPYFNSVPVLGDMIELSGVPMTKGVKIGVGQTKTIDIQLFSDGPTKPWKITPYDYNETIGGDARLAVKLDRDTGSNGDTVHLTLTVLTADPNFGGEPFLLVSDLDGQSSVSMGVVGR